MVREKYAVQLTQEERNRLERLVRAGKSSARITARVRILLKIGEGWTAPRAAGALDVSEGTVLRTKRRFTGDGLDNVCIICEEKGA